MLVSQAVPPPQLSELSTAWELSDCLTVSQDVCPLGQLLAAVAAGAAPSAENPQAPIKRMDARYGTGLATRTMFLSSTVTPVVVFKTGRSRHAYLFG
jgi:hypothetical protein